MAETLQTNSFKSHTVLSVQDGFYESLLSNMPLPVCVIDRKNEIIFSNAAFQFLCRRSPQFITGDRFLLRNKEAYLSYKDSFDKIILGQSTSETLFLAATKTEENLWTTLTAGGRAGTVMITILSPGLMTLGRETMECRLRTLFGLTGMEARCALLLARGLSANAIAEERGVSLPTIRTQLRAIREKMCVTSSLAVAAQVSKLAMPFGEAEMRI